MTAFFTTWGEAAMTSLGFFWMALWAFALGYTISSMIQVFVTQERMRRTMGDEPRAVGGVIVLQPLRPVGCHDVDPNLFWVDARHLGVNALNESKPNADHPAERELAQVFAEPSVLSPLVREVLVHIPASNAELLLLQRPEETADATEQLVQAVDPLDRRLELEVPLHAHHASHTHIRLLDSTNHCKL